MKTPKKYVTVFTVSALFIVATLPADDFLSGPYIVKSLIALLLLIVSLIGILKRK